MKDQEFNNTTKDKAVITTVNYADIIKKPSITGKHCDMIIIDDPVDPENYREFTFEDMRQAISKMKPKGIILMTNMPFPEPKGIRL